MSDNITGMIGGHERIAYTIEHRGNCILIDGAVPATAFTVLTKLVPKRSVMDPNCARIWGVTFAAGPEKELLQLAEEGKARAIRRERIKHPSISDAAVNWLAAGERGISSNYIFTKLTGIDAMNGWGTERENHPHDPADFRRCQLLLEQVPEFQHWFKDMRQASPVWARLVDAWPSIVAAMDEETPKWRDRASRGRATKAYELIKTAIGR